jgi:putative hydrolase of the HAD superfamily
MIAVVVFDLGGVVCRFEPARRLAALAAHSDLTPREIQARLWDSGFDADCERGRYSAAETRAEVRARIGYRGDDDALLAAWARAFLPDDDVLALADRLRARFGLALLTNNGPLLREALPRHLPELAQRFDPLLCSCELCLVKPRPELFRAAGRRLASPPEQLLLVDDSEANVVAARRCGWQALQAGQTLAVDLQALLG